MTENLKYPVPAGEPEVPPPATPPGGEALQPVIMPDEDPPEIWGLTPAESGVVPAGDAMPAPNLTGRRKTPRLVKKVPGAPTLHTRSTLTGAQRLLLLDTWRRSGLPAGDFAVLVGVSAHTLYEWRRKFNEGGPAALMDSPRGQKGSRLPEPTIRAILMLKDDNPEWGCQRISDVLSRAQGLSASPGAIANVLHENGYELEDVPTRPHPDKVRRFERASANQLWQTDLFTFVLKRQNRRVFLVAFMDDHSRFIVSYGLHATASAALVIEVLRAGIASYQAPTEILTDNGSQYITWRGKSAFTRECAARGIRHLVASPRRPQTLGKVERFWGSLWQECLGSAIFTDLEDARRRIGLFIDHYNFQRPHQGIDGLVPADRFFGAAPEILATLKARVDANACSLAVNGTPSEQLYVAGKVGDTPVSLHTEGGRVILVADGGQRKEIDLVPPPKQSPQPLCPHAAPPGDEGNEPPPPPGTSVIDEVKS